MTIFLFIAVLLLALAVVVLASMLVGWNFRQQWCEREIDAMGELIRNQGYGLTDLERRLNAAESSGRAVGRQDIWN